MNWAPHFLEHPLARGRDLDDPSTTALRREIIRAKPFLRAIYRDWYRALASHVDESLGPVIEVGSGAADAEDAFVHRLVRTDLLLVPDLDVVLDATHLPFRDRALGALILTNVFHHIPEPSAFLGEAERCLKPGGILAMIEPWLTPWSRFVYRTFHHEPLDPSAGWRLERGGPLSHANGALPWIVFERDRRHFTEHYPRLEVAVLKPMMPFRYLVSGGVSRRTLMPGWTTGGWRALENSLQPLAPRLGMFALIVLRRTST